jgi:hypothetical protein
MQIPAVPADLAKALALAQTRCKAVPHDKKNEYHGYRYTSAEAILIEAKEALTAAGLALVPIGQDLVTGEGHAEVRRTFLLMHLSGQSVPITASWPVVPDRGRPLDKAFAGAVTTSLAYLLRDLLVMPRVDEADDLAARQDRPKKTIGLEGANKLTALAAQKNAILDKYLEKFAPAEDLTPEQARHIWKQLTALPDPGGTNGPRGSNGRGSEGRVIR